MPIYLHNEDQTHFLNNEHDSISWLENAIIEEGYQLGDLNYIFCSDEYILSINRTYLNHDYYTDVITFDNSTINRTITGDIYISIERVQEHSQQYKTNKLKELHRIMIHGLLHLLGYLDKEEDDKIEMTLKEDTYLSLLKQ
jgi:probable rRNA maturation factor